MLDYKLIVTVRQFRLFLCAVARFTINLNINSFLYSLFHILMTKTSYDQLENFKRIEKKIENSWVNQIAAFDHKHMK